MNDLASLKNLGPKSVDWLRGAGIDSPAALKEAGAVLAYKIVKHRFPEASVLLLYALHGALTDTHWNELSAAEKAVLRREAEGVLEIGRQR